MPQKHREAGNCWSTNTDSYFSPEAAAAFNMAADRRIADDPWGYYVRLPLHRARRLWFPQRNIQGSMQRVGEKVCCLVTLGVLLLPVSLAFRIRRPPLAVLLILVGAVLVYTVLSAWWPGAGESRRNLPFYPLLCYTLFYWPVRGDDPQAADHTA